MDILIDEYPKYNTTVAGGSLVGVTDCGKVSARLSRDEAKVCLLLLT